MSAITGQLASQIRVAITGHVYVAPTGTAAPTSSQSVLNAAFQDLGFTDPTGVVVAQNDQWNDINVWQSAAVARKVPKSRDTQFKLVLEQMNSVTVPLYTSGSTVSLGTPSTEYTYSVDSQLTAYERALVVDGFDGSTVYRFYVPRCQVVAVQDLTLSRSTEFKLGLTFEALVPTDGTTKLYYVFSNDANLTS